MITIHVHKNAKDVVAYHDSDLTHPTTAGDYLGDGNLVPATLFGKGAQALGVAEDGYSRETFSALASNRHPKTLNQLTPSRKENARSAYDFTVSAPKSVSVVGVMLGDTRVNQAHAIAVKEAMSFLESRAMTRVRKSGQDADRTTGNIVGAQFRHFTSRGVGGDTPDPQLHDHCLVFNMTHDSSEQRWKALQSFGLFKATPLASEVYRSALARELHAIGYETRSTTQALEIVGIEDDVLKVFSKRHRDIEKRARNLGLSDNPEARASIARESRDRKEKDISIEDVRKAWKSQLSDAQLRGLSEVVERATRPINQDPIPPAEALLYARNHLFERASVASKDSLFREAFRYARGHFTLQDLEQSLGVAKAKGVLIQVGDKVTTAEAIEAEKTLIGIVNGGSNQFLEYTKDFQLAETLTKEQKQVVEQTLTSTDRFTAIYGSAGTGKSTILSELVRAIESSQDPPILLAPSGASQSVLHDDGFTDCQTLQRFLLDEAVQPLASERTVILDEAGMVSVQQMLSLARASEKHNFRVILVGDVRQTQSVEWGDALRILKSSSNMQSASLQTLMRQKHEQYKQAVSRIKDGDATGGFDILDSLGWVEESSEYGTTAKAQKLATDFASSVQGGHTALAVSPTWREARAVTEAIRGELRSRGMLGNREDVFSVLSPKHLTVAERQSVQRTAQGSVLVFQRNVGCFKKGENVTVVGELEGLVEVETAKGAKVTLDARETAKDFQVYDREVVAVSKGDRLLIRSNAKTKQGRKFVNGEIVTVKGISNKRIKLTDGRTLPIGFNQFTHGYCVSVHSSQGKTVDSVFLSIDSQSAGSLSMEHFYVSASRGRHQCRIYTDAKSELREAITNTSARQAALELLAEKTHEHNKHNERSGHVSAPRQLAPRARRDLLRSRSGSPSRNLPLDWGVPPRLDRKSDGTALFPASTRRHDRARSILP